MEFYTSTPALVVGLVVVGAITYYLRQFLLPRPIPGIPYDRAAAGRVLGDLLGYASAVNERDWIINRGLELQSPIFQLFLGPHLKPTVFVTDWSELVDVTTRRFKDFDRSDMHIEGFKPLQPESRFTIHLADPRYKRNNELVKDLMTPQFLNQVSAPHIYGTMTRLMELWDQKIDLADNKIFDVGTDIHNTALDIIAMASYGLQVERTHLVKEIEEVQRTATAGKHAKHVAVFQSARLNDELAGLTLLADSLQVALRSPIPKIHYTLYATLSSSMRKAKRGMERLRKREIEAAIRRRDEGQAEWCAVDSMIAREAAMAQKEGKKSNPHAEVISSELLSYLLGGHETTSAVVRWGINHLIDHQDVQTKLRQELKDAFPEALAEGRALELAEILKIRVPYLDAVVEETLRYSKVLPITMRDALVDTEVMGIPIPKGTTVALVGGGPGVTMRNLGPIAKKYRKQKKYGPSKYGQWDDADIEDYVPERWLKQVASESGETTLEFDPNAGPNFSFGLGPRGCGGKRLAYLELKVIYMMLVWKYEFRELPEAYAEHEEVVLLARAPKHVHVNLKRNY